MTGRTTSVMHIVLVRWRSFVGPMHVQELADLVGALPDAIPGMLAARSGPSSSTEGLESGFEWALFAEFETRAARDVYVMHPSHEPVKALIVEWATEVVVFDLG
jgi:Stress responsive A/B Barrel Domain